MYERIEAHIVGSNTGGSANAQELLRQVPNLRGSHFTVTDKKEGRAHHLATLLEQAGAQTEAYEGRGEEILPTLDHTTPAVLLIDELAPMTQILREHTDQVILAQGNGRGPGRDGIPGPAFGLTWAGLPERPEERSLTADFTQAMAVLAPPQSSQVIRVDAVNAMRLAETRRRTSAKTIERLRFLDRTREEELINGLEWNNTHYGLLIARRQMPGLKAGEEQALDLAAGKDAIAVALFSLAPGPTQVDLFVLTPRTRTNGHFVQMFMPLGMVSPPPPVIDITPMSPTTDHTRTSVTRTRQGAAFTD